MALNDVTSDPVRDHLLQEGQLLCSHGNTLVHRIVCEGCNGIHSVYTSKTSTITTALNIADLHALKKSSTYIHASKCAIACMIVHTCVSRTIWTWAMGTRL